MSILTRYWDRDGNPISWTDYNKLSKDPSYRVVEDTRIGPYRLVTTWHGQGAVLDNEARHIFTTRIKRGSNAFSLHATWVTETAALIGHRGYVRVLKWTYWAIRAAETTIAALLLLGVVRLLLWLSGI